MIFQPELNPQRIFPQFSSGVPTLYAQKGLNLTREERLLLRRQEKRRRQIQEIKAGCKRFIAMLFSHIGLSGVVIAYTIIGAVIFGGLEQEFERGVKAEAQFVRENNTLNMIESVFRKLNEWLDSRKDPCNQTQELVRYLLSSVAQSRIELERAKAAAFPKDVLQTTEAQNISDKNATSWDLANYTTTANTETELSTITEVTFNPFHNKFFRDVQYELNKELLEFTRKVVSFIDEKGWNGNESMDDLKWSFAGAVLYAITVITTIGYGHTAPRTDPGKMLTIIYALIGIPLVFLYLSNIGDYLADVFRALYSRTCRNTCENYCSISLISSIAHSFVKRYRGSHQQAMSAEQPQLDAVVSTTHSQGRRRKRVLLKTFSNVVADEGNTEEEETSSDAVKNLTELDAVPLPESEEPQEPIRASKGNTFGELIRRTWIYRIIRSPKMATLFKRTTITLNELVEPVTQWIQRTTYGLLLPMEPIVIHNKSAEPNNNLHYGNSLNFQPLGLGNASLLVQTPDSAGLSGQNIPLQVGMGNFSGRTEEKPSFSRETLITNQNFGKIGQYNLLPVGMTSTLSASLSAQMEIPPTDPTSTVLPSAQSTTRNNMQVNQARYFTFDGQHRKFYLDARYLRSAERQRRHKRRMAKRMREQMRLEENRLRNALSYGNIDAIRRKTMTGRNRTSGKPPEQTLEILSLDSDTETEVSIPLICWKDIDLDLEVRSIDDEKELSKLVDESPQVTPFTTSTLPQSTQASRVGQLDSRKMSHRTEKANAVYQETSAGVEFQGMETSDSTKIMKWIQNNKPRALLAPSITSGVQAAGIVKDAKTASMKQDDCVRKTNVANFTIFENPLAQDMESASDDNYPITMEKTRPVPSDKQTLPANVATSTEVKRSRMGRTGTEALCDIRSTHPSTSAESRYCPKFSTLQFNSTNVTQFPPINSSQRFQRQHAQSLANSVVIQNRAATERMEDDSVEKALAQGKSRLSIASSRGDPNSDVQVQLSYYSKQDSAHTEEDLSLFTFGDGFSSEEDISKVTVPISLSLLIMATYIVIGAIVFSIWEDKKYLKWSYFCFITLSTIGFGDIVPGTKIDSENTKEKLVIISLYVAIGLSVFAMCFKLMQEEVVHKVKWLASKVGIIKGKTKKKQEKSL